MNLGCCGVGRCFMSLNLILYFTHCALCRDCQIFIFLYLYFCTTTLQWIYIGVSELLILLEVLMLRFLHFMIPSLMNSSFKLICSLEKIIAQCSAMNNKEKICICRSLNYKYLLIGVCYLWYPEVMWYQHLFIFYLLVCRQDYTKSYRQIWLKFLSECLTWPNLEVIRFWWWSESASGSRIGFVYFYHWQIGVIAAEPDMLWPPDKQHSVGRGLW